MGFILYNGVPGTTWTNTGDRLAYQLIVTWSNTCGVCAQYDHAIGNSWPIPFHYGCNCHQHAIYPGGESDPFVDFRAEIEKLDPEERVHVVGAANYRLLKKGVVSWDDIVTEGRIRSLCEVVSIRNLDVNELLDAGISQYTAEQAWQSVHTAAHEIAEQERKAALTKLKAKGMDVNTARKLIAERLSARVSIGNGPSGREGSLVKLTPLPPPPGPKPKPVILPIPEKPTAQLTEDQIRLLFGLLPPKRP
jgi:hypothetical protein